MISNPNIVTDKAAIYYHFTGLHSIQHIQANGLTKGLLPWNLDREGNATFRRGFQWLTTNPNWTQAWCLNGHLPFPKNAYRITVCVPFLYRRRVFAWLELCRRCLPDSAEEINRTGGDVENWHVYAGAIRPEWFLAVDRNTNDQLIAEKAELS